LVAANNVFAHVPDIRGAIERGIEHIAAGQQQVVFGAFEDDARKFLLQRVIDLLVKAIIGTLWRALPPSPPPRSARDAP